MALAAEIAEGWLPVFFAPQKFKVFEAALEEGFGRAGGGKGFAGFDIAPTVPVVIGDDVDACRNAVKPQLALYMGGMGARGQNFYNKLCRRYGYEEVAETLQNLYLSGKKEEAAAAVPDELVDEVALCGPRERIAERLELWKKAPVTTLNINVSTVETLRTMAELVL